MTRNTTTPSPKNPDKDCDCLIVGAGISGLLAAATLKRGGANVRILEKGRGLGGRMATRRRDGAIFDHGAQFFTVRDQRFRTWASNWIRMGLAKEWYTLAGSGIHYRGEKGMTSIAKLITADYSLDIRRNTQVEKIVRENGRWWLTCEDGREHHARTLLLTAPVPQSLELLRTGEVDLPDNDLSELSAIKFGRCIAAMAILERESAIEAHGGALKLEGQPITWIGDNQRKGISPVPSVTIHSTPEFADEYWDIHDDVRLPLLLEAAAPYLKSNIVSCEGRRWGYSHPIGTYSQESYTNPELGLAIAGDGLAGGRVEGAAVSGLAAAEELTKMLADSTVSQS